MRVALQVNIMVSLKYPLVALTLTLSQNEKLMIPIYQTVLPYMGVNHNMTKAYYRFGPKSHQRLGYPQIYTKQGIM